MPQPLQYDAAHLDLSSRFFRTTTVVGSPADDTETIVASVVVSGDIALVSGVYVVAFCAFTVGTDGVSANLKVRRTDASGTTVVASGVVNEGGTAATQLGTRTVVGFDALGQSVQRQVYVATLTVGSASAESTVSAVTLAAVAA